jgi:histidyl-tRNA synthetase
MYSFSMGDESISLRPEATASVVRACVEHSLHRSVASGYPERYYYIGPMFRYERPQKGRQRQFHQVGAEVLGSAEPLADAETIQMVDAYLEELGIATRELVLNSVGDAECRPRFRRALVDWLGERLERLCEDCRRRYEENPLRVFDCKVEADRELLKQAPTAIEMLCGGCREHFAAVRAALDGYGVPYRIDPHVVRGLDYYARTVFEVVSPDLGAQNAILGGGRYDGLVEELGGPSIPGFGFSIGMERLILLLPDDRSDADRPDVALISVGAAAWRVTVDLARRLRAEGLACVTPLVERPTRVQIRRADRSGARFAVFVGEDELAGAGLMLKDLQSGQQERMDEASLVARIKDGRDDDR